MAQQALSSASVSNFNLKQEVTELFGTRHVQRVDMTIEQLERIRTHSMAVPASKHALEVICGASCDTGAM
jgi:hypothetical protein